jgi:hypothetical protein
VQAADREEEEDGAPVTTAEEQALIKTWDDAVLLAVMLAHQTGSDLGPVVDRLVEDALARLSERGMIERSD